MHIGILSVQSFAHQNFTAAQHLAETAQAMGHEVTFLRWDALTWHMDANGVHILFEGAPLPDIDVVLSRPRVYGDPTIVESIIDAFGMVGIPVLNSGAATRMAKSKVQQYFRLADADVPLPATEIVYSSSHLKAAGERLGWPLIIKACYGSGGIGVFKTQNLETARPIVDFLLHRGFDDPAILQAYIPEASQDIRAFVVDGTVIASMTRTAAKGEFRANMKQGSKGTALTLSDDEAALCVQATHALGLDIAGVDLVRTPSGPLVLEVNANPGMDGITEATSIPVAEAIVTFACQVAQRRSSDTGKA